MYGIDDDKGGLMSLNKDEIREVIKEFENCGRVKVLEENIIKMNDIIMGSDEKIGLCEKVRNIQKTLVPLWTLVSLIGGALLIGLVKLSFGG